MQKQAIKCGWGKADITPAQKTPLRGQFYQRIPTHTNDPLYATALAIEPENGELVIWISLDLVSFTKDVKVMLSNELSKHIPEFSIDRFICSCIHNHTGPYLSSRRFRKNSGDDGTLKINIPEGCITPEEYVESTFIPNAVKACVEAYNSLKPAGFSSVLGHATIGHCRRIRLRDGSSIMYGDSDDYNFDRLEGPADSGVEMMYIYDEHDELTGIIINVNCPAQVVEGKNYYSADFIGAFRQQLTKKFRHEIFVLSLIGASGNISPRDLVRQGRGEPSMREWEGAEEIGRRLLNCFEYNLEKANTGIVREVEFSHIYDDVPLLIRTVSNDDAIKAKAVFDEIYDKYNGDISNIPSKDSSALFFAKGIINRAQLQKKTSFYDTPVHVIRLGDSVFITNPFELYIEYGMRMRARSKAVHTFTAQLTDDGGAYLPTPEAVLAKSYSTGVGSCLVSCEGAEMLTETSIRMINSLFE
jgi:hypothetical protein